MLTTELFFLIDSVSTFLEKLLNILEEPTKSYAKQEWQKYKMILTDPDMTPLKCFSYSNALIFSKPLSTIPVATFRLKEIEINTPNKEESQRNATFHFNENQQFKLEDKSDDSYSTQQLSLHDSLLKRLDQKGYDSKITELQTSESFFQPLVPNIISNISGVLPTPLKEVSLQLYPSQDHFLYNSQLKQQEGYHAGEQLQNEGIMLTSFEKNISNVSIAQNNSGFFQMSSANQISNLAPLSLSQNNNNNNNSFSQFRSTTSMTNSNASNSPQLIGNKSQQIIQPSRFGINVKEQSSSNSQSNLSSSQSLQGNGTRLKSPPSNSAGQSIYIPKTSASKLTLQKLKGIQQTPSPQQLSLRKLSSKNQTNLNLSLSHIKAQKSLQIEIKDRSFFQKMQSQGQNSSRKESQTSRNQSKNKGSIQLSSTICNDELNENNQQEISNNINNNSIESSKGIRNIVGNIHIPSLKTDLIHSARQLNQNSINASILSSHNRNKIQFTTQLQDNSSPRIDLPQTSLTQRSYNEQNYQLNQLQSTQFFKVQGMTLPNFKSEESQNFQAKLLQGNNLLQNSKLLSARTDCSTASHERDSSRNKFDNNNINLVKKEGKIIDSNFQEGSHRNIIENHSQSTERDFKNILKDPKKHQSQDKLKLNLDAINQNDDTDNEDYFHNFQSSAEIRIVGVNSPSRGGLQVVMNRFDQNKNLDYIVPNSLETKRIGGLNKIGENIYAEQKRVVEDNQKKPNPYTFLIEKVQSRIQHFKMDSMTLELVTGKQTDAETQLNRKNNTSNLDGFSERIEIKRCQLKKISVFAKKDKNGGINKITDDQIIIAEKDKEKKTNVKGERKSKLIL